MKSHPLQDSSAFFSPSRLGYLITFPYLLLLFTGLIVPSDGSHGVFTIKSMSFIATTLGFISYFFLVFSFDSQFFKLFFLFLSFSLFLSIWFLFSAFATRDFTHLYDQLKLIIITFSVVMMTLFIAKEKLLSYSTFLKTLIYANFTYSLIKVGLVCLFLVGVIDLEFFLEKMGIRFMSMAIYGDVARLQTSVDILTPYLLYFALQSSNFKVHFSFFFKIIYCLISILAIFLSFSRFLLMTALLAFIFTWILTHLRSQFKWLTLSLIFISIVGGWIGYEKVEKVVELRFFSHSSYVSDLTRTEQINALLNEFYQFPLLGKGIGSYSKEIVRDKTLMHSYEVQWVAFLMQFGLIGITVLLFFLTLICLPFLSSPFSCLKICTLLVFFNWLAAGFFNPFLISLPSGIMFSLFAWTGQKLKREKISSPFISN